MPIRSVDDINFKRIGSNLKKYRKEKGYTQQNVADAISMQSYGNYERGTEQISLWRLLQICEYLHIGIEKAIEGSIPDYKRWTLSSEGNNEYRQLMEGIQRQCENMTSNKLQTMYDIAQILNRRR